MTGRMSAWTAAMREGRYEAAWALARQTLAERDPAKRDDPARPYHQRWVWDGTDVTGRDVQVRCYHGLGDTMQFARFLPILAERAASVTLEVQPRLLDLLAQVPGVSRAVPFDPAHPLPPAECDLEITELDLALRVSPSAVTMPYLSWPVAPLPAGTVALCYGSGDWDADRSIPPALLAKLCRARPSVTLMAEATTLDVLNPQGCPFDMGATASLVAGAALVITVDTMIAHLAGAMGRPTWLMLKAEPDWRWAPDRSDSAWYPTIRQYVQPRPGDWGSVIDRVAHDLASLPQRKVTP